MSFLHGVEIVNLTNGIRSIKLAATSIICLLGIAPKGPVNQLTQILGESDAAQFGKRLLGFNIPEALHSIFNQGAGAVFVVNVFDPELHVDGVTNEVVVVASGKFKLAFNPVGTDEAVIKDTDDNEYTKDTDYTLDEFGNGTVISSVIADGNIKATYGKLNGTYSEYTDALIGEVDGTTGARTGLKLFDLLFTDYGVKPKILIAPGYSVIPAVSSAMLTAAASYRAIVPIDGATGMYRAAAITARGINGTIGWNNSNSRAALLFPKWKKSNPDPRLTADIIENYSAIFAGMIAANDNLNGYWFSPSNKEIAGVVGPEIKISCSLTDSNAENQVLNAAGIITYFSAYGTGLRTWGNRSAMYPSDTAPLNFICVQRVADILHDSIEQAMLPFIDQPINKATIDAIRQSVNNFISTLIGKGALIDGECTFDPAKNSAEEIALGHITFDINYMPPTPGERVTFNATVDLSLLSKLTAN